MQARTFHGRLLLRTCLVTLTVLATVQIFTPPASARARQVTPQTFAAIFAKTAKIYLPHRFTIDWKRCASRQTCVYGIGVKLGKNPKSVFSLGLFGAIQGSVFGGTPHRTEISIPIQDKQSRQHLFAWLCVLTADIVDPKLSKKDRSSILLMSSAYSAEKDDKFLHKTATAQVKLSIRTFEREKRYVCEVSPSTFAGRLPKRRVSPVRKREPSSLATGGTHSHTPELNSRN